MPCIIYVAILIHR